MRFPRATITRGARNHVAASQHRYRCLLGKDEILEGEFSSFANRRNFFVAALRPHALS